MGVLYLPGGGVMGFARRLRRQQGEETLCDGCGVDFVDLIRRAGPTGLVGTHMTQDGIFCDVCYDERYPDMAGWRDRCFPAEGKDH